MIDINKNLELFMKGYGKNGGRHPEERYASFDYCFNYFQEFRERGTIPELASPQNLQLSCLQLGFYLASWGMYRGSSFLLEKSSRYLVPLIKNITSFDTKIWTIDIDAYTDENIGILLECRKMISDSFDQGNTPTDTLITKIMLGVFGNIPAFDSFIKKAFKLDKVDESSLKYLRDFYLKNKGSIDGHKVRTYDFLTGEETKRCYTKAKIVDMIGFVEGQYMMKGKGKEGAI